MAVLRSKLNDTNTNIAVETITPYQTPSPKKSQTPTTAYSSVYNYDYSHQDNGNNMNISAVTTPTMNDNPDDQNHIYSSNDILKKSNANKISNDLMLFTSNATALNKKPFFMVQEFLERAKVYINKNIYNFYCYLIFLFSLLNKKRTIKKQNKKEQENNNEYFNILNMKEL